MDFILEDLDWRKILIRRYKNYHLNENDLAVILLINELNRGVPHLISPEEIEPYTTLSSDKIESIMSKLIKAGYASIEGVSLSVNALKKKIFNDTIKEAALAEEDKTEINKDLSQFYQKIQEVIKRQVTSLECDIVSSWIAQNMTLEELDELIKQIKSKRKTISIAIIDKEYQTKKKNATKIKDNPEAIKTLSTNLYNNIKK